MLSLVKFREKVWNFKKSVDLQQKFGIICRDLEWLNKYTISW